MLYLSYKSIIIAAIVVLIFYILFKRKNNKTKAQKIIDKIENGLTFQTKYQFKLAIKSIGDVLRSDDGLPRVPESFNMTPNEPSADKIPLKLETVKLPKDVYYGVDFPIKDEDKQNPSFFKLLIGNILNIFPVQDMHSKFEDDKKIIDEEIPIWEKHIVSDIYKTFEHTFVDLDKYKITSDYGHSLMAFSGLGCHYTKKIKQTDFEKDDLLKKYKDSKLKDAKYMIDLRILGGFPVRDGYLKYGASAYFDDKYSLIGIYACEYDELFVCSDNKWEHIKWIFRVTLATVITFDDHLLQSHEIEAHALVIKTRENLPFDHPLRRFLKPFCYRTLYINHSASQNLIGKKQLVHRSWAYEYKEVNTILSALHKSYNFKLIKDKFNDMNDLPDEIYPIATDLNEYWIVTHKFVSNYINIYYKNNNDLINDKYINLWWKELIDGNGKKGGLRISKTSELYELNKENLINILTHLIINGSAWHQYVGNTIQEYLRKPYWMGSKIRPNATQSEIQSWIQVVTIGIFTGLPMPNIINDWKFVLLNDKYLENTKNVFNEWQNELIEMSKRVQKRNQKRRMPIKFLDPAHLDISVGI